MAYNYGNNAHGYQQLGGASRLVTNATIAVAGTYAAVGAGIVGGELLASQSPKLILRAQQLAHGLRVEAGHNTPLGTPIKAAIQAALKAGQYTVGTVEL